MNKSLDWYSAIVFAVVINILAMSLAEALMGAPFEPLAVTGAVFPLLSLPVLFKLAGRRQK